MPAFAAEKLSDAELDDLLAYLAGLGATTATPAPAGNR